MSHVDVFPDGFPGFKLSVEFCPKCGGNMIPNRRPSPDIDCSWCFGMGGGLAQKTGTPFLTLSLGYFYPVFIHLLNFAPTELSLYGSLKANEMLARLATSEDKAKNLTEDGPLYLYQLREIAWFADDQKVDVKWR